MNRFFIILISAVMFSQFSSAQEVKEVLAPFNKESRPAFSMQLNYSQKLVQEAVTKRFKDAKVKGKPSGKLMYYASAQYKDLCVNGTDVYTMVDGSSKVSTVYVYVVGSNGNFITGQDDQASCVKSFVSSLKGDVEALSLQNNIEAQKKEVKKAESNYKKLVDKKTKMEKDLKNLEKSIQQADNEREKQKGILEQMQNKAK